MSEAVRDAYGQAVALLLRGEQLRLRGDVLDAGGGAALFARTLPDACLADADVSGAAPESFDAVLSVSRLPLVEDPASEVAGMARACRAGGAVMIIVPHAMQEDLSEPLRAFTLRGLHSIASSAGLEVEYTMGINAPRGGVLRLEMEVFALQSPRGLLIPDEVNGWLDVMDEKRPMLLVCFGLKPAEASVDSREETTGL